MNLCIMRWGFFNLKVVWRWYPTASGNVGSPFNVDTDGTEHAKSENPTWADLGAKQHRIPAPSPNLLLPVVQEPIQNENPPVGTFSPRAVKRLMKGYLMCPNEAGSRPGRESKVQICRWRKERTEITGTVAHTYLTHRSGSVHLQTSTKPTCVTPAESRPSSRLKAEWVSSHSSLVYINVKRGADLWLEMGEMIKVSEKVSKLD